MEEVGFLSSSTASQAFAHLLATQQGDGSWDEDPQVGHYDLPVWIQLGDLKTRLYLSAYATYWLALGDYKTLPAFRKAIHFLLRDQDQAGKFYGYPHNTWRAAGVFLMAGGGYAKI